MCRGGGPSDEVEPVLLNKSYGRYYLLSLNEYIILLIVGV